jgi:hypothetical protein
MDSNESYKRLINSTPLPLNLHFKLYTPAVESPLLMERESGTFSEQNLNTPLP